MISNWQPELQLEWQTQLSDLVTAIACAPDGGSWVASSAAGEIIWNRSSTDPVKLPNSKGLNLPPIANAVNCIKAADGKSIDKIGFSADSQWLAAGGEAGYVLIWNCENSQLPPQLVSRIKIGKWIEHLAWQPIESHLAIGYGSHVKIWDIPNSIEISSHIFQGGNLDRQHPQPASVFDLAWHPNGEHLAMAGSKGVQIWAYLDANASIKHIEVDTATIAIAWARNGDYLAMGNFDRTLTVLDSQDPLDRWTLSGCPGKIRQIRWIEGTNTPGFAVASGSTVVLWDLTADATSWNGQCLEGHQDTITALAVHPTRSIIASASADGYTCLWSEQGEIYQIITEDLRTFTDLAWHPQSHYLLVGTQNGFLTRWAVPA